LNGFRNKTDVRNKADEPIKVIGQYDNFWLVDTGKDPRGGKKWMFVLKGDVEEYVEPVDDDAFPKDMTGYTKGTRSQYAKMGLAYPLHDAKVDDKTIKFHELSSPYGWYNPFGTGYIIHQGFDIVAQGLYSDNNKANPNLQLYAVGDGEVKDIEYRSGFGNTISLLLDQTDPKTDNRLWVLYGHLSQVPPESLKGKRVERDKPLTGCYMGKSGGVTGAHLHLQFCNNGTFGGRDFSITINPMYFYPNISFTMDNNNSTARYLRDSTGNKKYDWTDKVNYDRAAQMEALLYWDIEDKYKK